MDTRSSSAEPNEVDMTRVTMKDVADVMGVSVMTVSNAFNRPDQLSGELRDRILNRARKMGYGAPNAAARNLRQGAPTASAWRSQKASPTPSATPIRCCG